MNLASILIIAVAVLAFAQGIFFERRRQSRKLISVWPEGTKIMGRYENGRTAVLRIETMEPAILVSK